MALAKSKCKSVLKSLKAGRADGRKTALVEENWPFIIPPLLTVVDDDSTNYKAKGCELMTILLQVTPASTLSRTGLGELFEDAVLPYLAYLPTLTPEEESLQLLGAAYPALTSLTRTRFPGHSGVDARGKHLDRIVRQGILKGYYHAGEHAKVTELLVGQISVLVDEMGIWAVKHLKVWISDIRARTSSGLTPRRISCRCSLMYWVPPSQRLTLHCSWRRRKLSKASLSTAGPG